MFQVRLSMGVPASLFVCHTGRIILFFLLLSFFSPLFAVCVWSLWWSWTGYENIKSVSPILPLTLFTKACLKKVCFSPPKVNAQHVMSVVNPLNGWPVYRKLELQRHLKKQTKKKKTLLLGRVCWVLPLRFTCNTFKQSKCHRHSQRDVL